MSQSEFDPDDFMEPNIVEKEKRKRQPDPSYNQDVALGIITLTLGLLVLSRTDVLLIRAIVVRGYYPHGGILGLVLFAFTLLAILWWAIDQLHEFSLEAVFTAVIFLVVGCPVVLGVILYIDSLGWKTMEVVPAWLFLPTFGTALMGWWWVRRAFALDPLGVKIMTILVMGFAAFYFVGLWSLERPPGGLIGDLVFNDRRYYAYYEWQGISDSGIPIEPRLSLYECNRHGLFCTEFWAVNHDRYYNDVSLNLDPETNTLALIVNGEVLYIHTR